MKEIIIDTNNSGQRFDKFLFRLLSNTTNSFVYKMLRKKNITLNDKKSDGKDILSSGDSVKIWFSDETYEKLTSIDIEVSKSSESLSLPNIIYEDKDVLIINKPVGVLSQKADNNDISLNEMIIDYLLNSGQIKKEDLNFYKPSTVNRLDRNTSGLIVAAKNLKAAQILSEGFKDRSINKYYKCLVHGHVDKSESIKGYLSKDNKTNKVKIFDIEHKDSSYIETEYEPLETINNNTLLNVHLITGKTHQIRAHLASIGHPLCGDHKYGIKDKYKHQCLHCYKVVFPKYEGFLENISEKSFYGDMEKPWS